MHSWNRAALVTATEAATRLHGVSVHLIGWWVGQGKLAAVDRRGRSPLYRWGDLLDIERATRLNPRSSRNEDRAAARAA